MPYIAEKNYLLSCEQGCKIMSYNFKMSDFNLINNTFPIELGHRMEVQSHNFVIFRNVINLSFSYMTFVIKNKFDQNTHFQCNKIFDLEGSNYIIERKSIFTTGDLVIS
jgi:hypothetical protein